MNQLFFWQKWRKKVVSHLEDYPIFNPNFGIIKPLHIKISVAFKSVHFEMLWKSKS